jgi:hypothetical protein
MNLHHSLDAAITEIAQPERRAAHQHRFRADRERLQHISAAPLIFDAHPLM